MQPAARSKTFCEFFAGIGLIYEALRRTGWNCIYANDKDPNKKAIYLAQFPEADYYHEADVWATSEVVGRIPRRPFLATASFPCTDMSLAGHRKGFRGEESSALFGFAAVVERLGADRPALLLLENVVGFLASRDGRDFRMAVERLAELGYWIDSFVLDAKDFVPQSRPRLFVIGYHETLDAPGLIRAGNGGSFLADPWRQAIAASSRLRPQRLRLQMEQIDLPTGWATVPLRPPQPRSCRLADFLDCDERQPWWGQELVDKHRNMMSARHRRQVDQWLAEHQRKVATVYRRIRKGRQRAEVRLDGIAGCLRTPRGGSARQIVLLADAGQLRMRWMTPREYARLQGADSYTLDHPPSRALFGFGDAVCVPVICWIDENILSPIFRNTQGKTA